MFIKNTFLFTAVSSITKTTLGIALDILLTSRMVKMKSMQRMLVFLPQVMSFLIIGLVFKNILHPSRGFINITLKAIGLDFLAQNWLGDLDFAFKSIFAVDAWKGTGYVMTVSYTHLDVSKRQLRYRPTKQITRTTQSRIMAHHTPTAPSPRPTASR